MDSNEEIKKDQEALRNYLKEGYDSDYAFKKFAETFSKNAGMIHSEYIAKVLKDETSFKSNYRTPARISVNREKGIIEIPKSLFTDKTNPEYHRTKLKIFDIMFMVEVCDMSKSINDKSSTFTKELINNWYNHVDRHLKEYNEAKLFLKKLGEEIKTNWYVVGQAEYVKSQLIKKFWWRMGWVGIERRIKLYKSDSWIKEFLKEKDLKNENNKKTAN